MLSVMDSISCKVNFYSESVVMMVSICLCLFVSKFACIYTRIHTAYTNTYTSTIPQYRERKNLQFQSEKILLRLCFSSLYIIFFSHGGGGWPHPTVLRPVPGPVIKELRRCWRSNTAIVQSKCLNSCVVSPSQKLYSV